MRFSVLGQTRPIIGILGLFLILFFLCSSACDNISSPSLEGKPSRPSVGDSRPGKETDESSPRPVNGKQLGSLQKTLQKRKERGLSTHEIAAEGEYRRLSGDNAAAKFHSFFGKWGYEPGPFWEDFKDADKEKVLKDQLRANHWLKHKQPKNAREFKLKAKRLEFMEMVTRQKLLKEEDLPEQARQHNDVAVSRAKEARTDQLKGRVKLWQKLQEKHCT